MDLIDLIRKDVMDITHRVCENYSIGAQSLPITIRGYAQYKAVITFNITSHKHGATVLMSATRVGDEFKSFSEEAEIGDPDLLKKMEYFMIKAVGRKPQVSTWGYSTSTSTTTNNYQSYLSVWRPC
jgi:hypothetical protein